MGSYRNFLRQFCLVSVVIGKSKTYPTHCRRLKRHILPWSQTPRTAVVSDATYCRRLKRHTLPSSQMPHTAVVSNAPLPPSLPRMRELIGAGIAQWVQRPAEKPGAILTRVRVPVWQGIFLPESTSRRGR